MALSIADLAVELRIVPDSISELADGDREVVSRLLNFASSMVTARTANAPEPLHDQAVIQIAAYRFDQPNASAGAGYADVWRNSGAAATLASYTLFRRAIAIDVDPEFEAGDRIPLTIEAAITEAIAAHTAQPFVHHDPPNVSEDTIRRIVSDVLEGAGLEPIAPDERPLYFAYKVTDDFTEADYLAGVVSDSDFFDIPVFDGEVIYSLAEPADRIRRRFIGALGGYDFLAAGTIGEIAIGSELHRTYTLAYPAYGPDVIENWVASPPIPFRFVSNVSPQAITDTIAEAIAAHAAIVAAHHQAPDVSAFVTFQQVAAAIAVSGHLTQTEVATLIAVAIAAIPEPEAPVGGGAAERLWTAADDAGTIISSQGNGSVFPLSRELVAADAVQELRLATKESGTYGFSMVPYFAGTLQYKAVTSGFDQADQNYYFTVSAGASANTAEVTAKTSSPRELSLLSIDLVP